jgi:hypothetical protein
MKTLSMKKVVARKAAKATVKHTAYGTASRLKRSPMRAVTLLAIGALIGVLAGWLLARGGSSPEAPFG